MDSACASDLPRPRDAPVRSIDLWWIALLVESGSSGAALLILLLLIVGVDPILRSVCGWCLLNWLNETRARGSVEVVVDQHRFNFVAWAAEFAGLSMMWNAADKVVANNNTTTKRSDGDASRDGSGAIIIIMVDGRVVLSILSPVTHDGQEEASVMESPTPDRPHNWAAFLGRSRELDEC